MSEATLRNLLNDAYRYAFALCQDRPTAEDLVQMAWLGILKSNGPRDRAYLFRAVRNHYININKRHQLVPMDSLDALEESDNIGATQSESEHYLNNQEVEYLLNTLRGIEREFVFLHYYQGFTHQEIAALTNTSRNTVLSIVHRAIGKMKQQLVSVLEAEQ